MPLLLTVAVSALIGVGLRDYYEREGKFDTFGTVRTFIFLGLLGFVLYLIPVPAHAAYLLGLGVITPFLLAYYNHKIRQYKSLGLIGVIIAFLTYAMAPIGIHEPPWFLLAIAISILLVLHSKGRIRQFTNRLATGEVVTLCKFLAIAAVILPLIPQAIPATGLAGRIFSVLPVTPRQIWMAVVVTTAISYLGYVFQTYLYPRRGMLLTGLVGGLYSSTLATLVLSRRTRNQEGQAREAAAAILLSTPTMYLRMLFLVVAFRPLTGLGLLPSFLVLSVLIAGYAWWVRRGQPPEAPAEAGPGAEQRVEVADRNPLELSAAFLFALMFVSVAFVTKYVLLLFNGTGLRALSLVVGASDIVPFVVSVLQSSLGLTEPQILHAIIIATASNNLMKAVYVYLFGHRRTAHLTAVGMAGLALLSFLYVAVV
ncbi:MAG: DUF4010 domain-containing protein [Holophaga sp.]|jgi:uncharacterized membrane protein (DUF4010 family)